MVILTNSVFGTGRNYYPQVLLEECKYIVRKRCPITDDIEICSDSDRENPDEETSNEENSEEENVDEKNLNKPIKYLKIFFLYIKKWQLNIIKTKKKLSKKALEMYQNLSEEE